MSDLDVQTALSLRYKTSVQADGYTDQLRQSLGLDTRAQVARLAIGRSLAMGRLANTTTDSHGKDIPASSMFTPENIGAWVGLLVTHSLTSGGQVIDSMEGLRTAIRGHWHRGAVALWSDWQASDQNYDKFIEALMRRSEMPDFAPKQERSGTVRPTEGPADGAHPDASAALTKALAEVGIKVQVKGSIHGPRMTRYRVLLLNLADSAKLRRSMSQLGLALNLGSFLPTISNGDEAKTLFIDLPRPRTTWDNVAAEKLTSWAGQSGRDLNELMVYAGVSVTGDNVTFDLVSAPHLLVGGTTGSGKSVCLHSLILSLILRHKPESLQLALIDPKQVEFSRYAKLPNLYRNGIAVELAQAREMLQELGVEMEARYQLFSKLGVSNIQEARKKGTALPFIVVVIEELADLVLQDDSIETFITRLAQKARAAGIHLILATQRPDSDTFSGLIRSNIPSRIALTVQKGSESTIILDEKGAENLLNYGDMLIKLPGQPIVRAHGVFVRGEDIDHFVATAFKS